jgi:putative addiction module CopG family antidote
MDIASLPPDVEQFVQAQLATGKYESASDVVSDAVRVMRERQTRLEILRKEIEAGISDLDSGKSIKIESDAELRAFFEDIRLRSLQRLSAKTSEQ